MSGFFFILVFLAKQNEIITPKLPHTCLVIVIHNRVENLNAFFHSLHNLNVLPAHILVSTDSQDDEIISKIDQILSRQDADMVVQTPLPYGLKMEQSIGLHIRHAIDSLFEKYYTCDFATLIEDDLQISPDYFHVVNESMRLDLFGDLFYHPLFFSGMNDVGLPHLGPWSKSKFRLTSYFPGMAWIVSKKKWPTIQHLFDGGRHWDNKIRSHPYLADETTIVPEISRVTHIKSSSSVHGNVGQQKHMDMLQKYNGRPVIMKPLKSVTLNSLQYCPSLSEMGLPGVVWQMDTFQILRGNLYDTFYTPAHGYCSLLRRQRSSYLLEITWILSHFPNMSCSSVCNMNAAKCAIEGFQDDFLYVPRLKKLTNCKYVSYEIGRDLPAYMPETRECLFATQPRFYTKESNVPQFGFCEAKHPSTRRFCPCISSRTEI